MDDFPQTADTENLTFPVRSDEPAADSDYPPGFVPLRLVLQPSGLMLELDRPDMTVGRHSSADIRLAMEDVSRRHCRFTWSEGVWQVRDLASLNGLHVNGRQVREASLHQNDFLRIGGFSFVIDLSYPAAPRVRAAGSGRLLNVVPIEPNTLPLPPRYRLAS